MQQQVKVKHSVTGAEGRVPERALPRWQEKGWEAVDVGETTSTVDDADTAVETEATTASVDAVDTPQTPDGADTPTGDDGSGDGTAAGSAETTRKTRAARGGKSS